MASGKKNYFRHSFFAIEDEKIQSVIDEMGFEGYGYFFSLLELLGRKCSESVENPITLHQQSLRSLWRKQSKSCRKVVEKLSKSGLFVATFTESFVEFDIPNFSKYLGRYANKNEPNCPNKRKEKKIKENKTKLRQDGAAAPSQEIIVAPQNSKKERTDQQKDAAKRIKTTFCDAYSQKYGILPVFAAKEHTLVYKLISSVGLEEAINLAREYPSYNDPWHIGQKHPFHLLVSQLSKVRIELDNPNRMLDSTIARTQITEAAEYVDGGKSEIGRAHV